MQTRKTRNMDTFHEVSYTPMPLPNSFENQLDTFAFFERQGLDTIIFRIFLLHLKF